MGKTGEQKKWHRLSEKAAWGILDANRNKNLTGEQKKAF